MRLFKINVSEIVARLRRQFVGRVGDITLNLPFISIAASPGDLERRSARELVIRLRNRRVLTARECCDECLDKALTSLHQIREALVETQVQLVDLQDGPYSL